MDYQIDLDPTHSAIRLTVTRGVRSHRDLAESVTLELAEDIYTRLTQLSSSGGPYAAIYDLSAAKRTTISAEMVRSYARRTPSVPMRKPHVVVGKEPAIYGLASVFQMCREFRHREFEVVHTLEEAYEIVGVQAEDFTKRLYPEARYA